MSKKRQTAIFDPRGSSSAQLTTLSYNYDDGHLVEMHFHHEDQLVFASKGVMTVRTQHGIWVVPPLRAVWIPSKELHSIHMSGVVLMRTLYFTPRVTKKFSRKCFVMNISPFFRELILHACEKPEWKLREPTERRIIEVIIDQLRAVSTISLQLSQPTDMRANRIVELLIKDPSDQRPLATLCKESGGSKRTIERLFLEETGMTFGKWRQQLRLLHGMRLLASGETVINSALGAGYDSPSAFISMFKKALGTTPNKYIIQ
jgi:AraC-like DNA-binding protein